MPVYLLLQEIRVDDSQLFPESAAADPPTEPADAFWGETKDLDNPEDDREAETKEAHKGGTVSEGTTEVDADAKVNIDNILIYFLFHALVGS